MNNYNTVHSVSPEAQIAGLAVGSIFFIFMMLFFIAVYVYYAYSLYVMAKKLNQPDPWMAWVPILNIFLFVKMAGKPIWWIVFLLIPLINVVVVCVLWYEIALKLRKPGWLGIVVGIVPILIGILAFTDDSAFTPPDHTPPTPPPINPAL